MASLEAVDPADATALTSALTTAIASNPRLVTQMQPNPAQGTSARTPVSGPSQGTVRDRIAVLVAKGLELPVPAGYTTV
jgi:hypothetical protein